MFDQHDCPAKDVPMRVANNSYQPLKWVATDGVYPSERDLLWVSAFSETCVAYEHYKVCQWTAYDGS